MSTDRIEYLEYVSAIINANFIFVMRAPPLSFVSNIYILSFTEIVWVCSITMVVLSTGVIALTTSSRSAPNDNTPDWRTSDYFLFAIASVCQMSTNIQSKNIPTRIAMVSIVSYANECLSHSYYHCRSRYPWLHCSFIVRSRQVLWLCYKPPLNRSRKFRTYFIQRLVLESKTRRTIECISKW